MEELIEILINLIASFFQNRAIKPVAPPKRLVPQAPAPAPVRPVVQKKAPRRQARRPAPPPIAIAQPIMTGTATSAPAQYVVPMAARSTIVANTGIAAPNQTPSQSADSIRKWMTPATLKHQFLLTEILQKPLALRENQ